MKTFFDKYRKVLVLLFVLLVLYCFFSYGFFEYLTFENLKASQAKYKNYYLENPLEVILLFFFIYVFITGLSLPGALVMTLTAGALFGVVIGVIVVSFASVSGATISMLLSRFFFRDLVERKFSKQIKMVNQGLEKQGVFYLLSLRLVPVIPFFVVNLVLGLTKIRVRTFFIVSQLGMLLGTIFYVSAGAELSQLESISDIWSLEVVLLFLLLAVFVLIVKKFVEWYNIKDDK